MRIKEERAKSKEQRCTAGSSRRGRKFFLSSFSVAVFLLSSLYGNAQCAMCRASLESSGEAAQGKAVNDGIVYLMAIPYLLVAVVGYYVYRTRFGRKN